jgi:hypothetical protein
MKTYLKSPIRAAARVDSVTCQISSRSDFVLQILRIVGVERIFHRVQVIEVPEELIETVHGGQKLVTVTEVVFSKLPSRVTHLFQYGRDSRRLGGQADRGSRLADGCQPRPNGQFTGDEVSPAGGATRLGVIVGKDGPFTCEFVDVGSPAGHHTAVVRTDVPHADVIPHDEENIRLLTGILELRFHRGDLCLVDRPVGFLFDAQVFDALGGCQRR